MLHFVGAICAKGGDMLIASSKSGRRRIIIAVTRGAFCVENRLDVAGVTQVEYSAAVQQFIKTIR
jgi:hypothetical protein